MVQLSLPIPQHDNFSSPFDQIKHIDTQGNDCWFARELAELLGYEKWANFVGAIKRAKVAIKTSGGKPSDHIAEISNDTPTKQGVVRKLQDFKLSRLACYHVAQEADASKTNVALAKTYFIVQTRRQEVADENKQLEARSQKITAYQLQGKNPDWATARVESKESHEVLSSALIHTHEKHTPNYAEIGGTINKELFDKTSAEIVAHLGLLPKDSKNYRDHLGRYALVALKEINYASAQKMKSLKRELTSDEQKSIIRRVVRIVAPTMQELAQYANQDFISGAELDQDGNPQLSRNIRLLPKGDK